MRTDIGKFYKNPNYFVVFSTNLNIFGFFFITTVAKFENFFSRIILKYLTDLVDFLTNFISFIDQNGKHDTRITVVAIKSRIIADYKSETVLTRLSFGIIANSSIDQNCKFYFVIFVLDILSITSLC